MPRVIKNIQNKLPVIWKANRFSLVTKFIVEDWFKKYFCPDVEHYCQKNSLPFNVILILDSPANVD